MHAIGSVLFARERNALLLCGRAGLRIIKGASKTQILRRSVQRRRSVPPGSVMRQTSFAP